MNKSILSIVFITALMTITQPASAGDVTIPHKFTAGTTAVAAQVNANFDAVEVAVDDNYARILLLQSNPSLSGNLTLVPSTATAGNIMKGPNRFLHNYGLYNTFLGEFAGNFTMTGNFNTADGFTALYSNTSGARNTAIGTSALYSNTEGSNNTASGVWALYSNVTGNNNTASGYEALFQSTEGSANTANGMFALMSNTTGSYNTAMGSQALQNNTTNYYNTALGAFALFNTIGNGNTAIGYSAGFNLTDGVNNIVIDNSGVAGESHTIRIGDTQARTFIAGINGVAVTGSAVYVDSNGQLGITSSSRRVKDNIRDMGETSKVLMQLHPVTFYYSYDHNPQGRALQYGLIAEEVAAVAPELVAHSRTGEVESVYYQYLAPMLLNEFQRQQKLLEAQQVMLQQQARELMILKQQMAHLLVELPNQQLVVHVTATER